MLIARGAEAILYVERKEGVKVLVKERVKKGYRHPSLDERLRRGRTREEAKLLREARKCGVNTPQLLEVDEKSCKITMEFVEGVRVKEFFENGNIDEIKKVCEKIGESIGKLHSNGIIHGDLTTSNMIIKGDKVYFIDFGLGFFSRRIEDQGVDLNVLYEALRSTHFKILKICWRNIVKGYKKEYKDAERVLKKVEEIEARARYVERKR